MRTGRTGCGFAFAITAVLALIGYLAVMAQCERFARDFSLFGDAAFDRATEELRSESAGGDTASGWLASEFDRYSTKVVDAYGRAAMAPWRWAVSAGDRTLGELGREWGVGDRFDRFAKKAVVAAREMARAPIRFAGPWGLWAVGVCIRPEVIWIWALFRG